MQETISSRLKVIKENASDDVLPFSGQFGYDVSDFHIYYNSLVMMCCFFCNFQKGSSPPVRSSTSSSISSCTSNSKGQRKGKGKGKDKVQCLVLYNLFTVVFFFLMSITCLLLKVKDGYCFMITFFSHYCS